MSHSFFPLYTYPSSVKKTLFIASLAFFVFGACAQKAGIHHDPAQMVKGMMDKFHCDPPKNEDKLIHRIISTLIKELDGSKLYFTTIDIDSIYGSADMLKDELKGRDTRFLSKVMHMYKARLESADSAVSTILRKPLDYSVKEYGMVRDTNSVPSTIDLRKRWEQVLKYDCLRQMGNIALGDSSGTATSAMKQEPKMRDKICRSIQRRIRRPLTFPAGFEAYVSEELADAICKSYDPHSDFFSKSAKENFEGDVSGSSYLFGFDVGENEQEEVSIVHLLPGSPAWRCGELNKGDVILSLRWEGQTLMDLQGADAREVNKLLDDQNHAQIELGVRKADGTRKVVKLQKQKIEVEENFVKSYILDAGDVRVGYIVLPGFYTESESKNGKSCATDVARELVKLKKENIQSVILDLRNNGGGSMMEAMELAGIFIDEGILAFAKYKTERPMGLRDPNRGTIYDGPLIVMTNKASASASEMVAGALQDYNRALIVGSPTYGKATIQMVLPVDTNVNIEKYSEAAYRNNTEFVKVTLGRFYRVTGSSHQLKGVQPDIHLPDLTESAGYGESHMRYPLRPDSVKRATYFKPLPPMPVNELSAQSSERVNASDAFKMVGRYADFIQRSQKASQQPIPLQYEEYLSFSGKYRREANALEKEYEDMHKPGNYKTKNLVADAERIKLANYQADELKKTIENIDRDIYIQECFSIITNYLKPTKK